MAICAEGSILGAGLGSQYASVKGYIFLLSIFTKQSFLINIKLTLHLLYFIVPVVLQLTPISRESVHLQILLKIPNF